MNSDRQYDRTMELWRSYSIATSLELAAHLENFAILFSYNSGKIENREITYHDTHEIFKIGRACGYTGDLRTLYEIKNLKDASELMYRWFDERKPITLDSIREMQFELTKGTYNERRWELGERPGEFKKNDLWGVGMHDVAAPVDEIEDDLQQDLDEVSEMRVGQINVCESLVAQTLEFMFQNGLSFDFYHRLGDITGNRGDPGTPATCH